MKNFEKELFKGDLRVIELENDQKFAARQTILENHNRSKALGVILNIFKLYHRACRYPQRNLETHTQSKALRVILNIFLSSVTKFAARQKYFEKAKLFKGLESDLKFVKSFLKPCC